MNKVTIRKATERDIAFATPHIESVEIAKGEKVVVLQFISHSGAFSTSVSLSPEMFESLCKGLAPVAEKRGETRMTYAQFMLHHIHCEHCDWPLFRCRIGEKIRLLTTKNVPDHIGGRL